MMDPGMFLALTSDHHIPDHEHEHLIKHEDMNRRWHGCDWSTHESVDLLYFEPGITTAELLHRKGSDHGFICLTPEENDMDELDMTEEEDNSTNDGDSYKSFDTSNSEQGVSTHEPQLVILYKDGEPFVEEPKSILKTKSLVVMGTGGKEEEKPQPQKQISTPRPQPQFSKKRKPNSGSKRRKRGTKF